MSAWPRHRPFVAQTSSRGGSRPASDLDSKRLESAFCGEFQISAKKRYLLHISRSHCATVFGSNRTQVPMRNDGILPAFACLKIVILETVNMLASSSAVNARPIRSIRSGSDIGSAELSWGLHDCIYLLCGFTCGYCRILLWDRGSSPGSRA